MLDARSWNGSSFAVYRNPTALPRAYVVPRAVAAETEPKRVLAQMALVDPREAVLLDSDPLGADGEERQPFTPGNWVETNDPDRVVVTVTTHAPGLLVVADTWMPGWSATLNGRAVPILRGNHAQRVIALPGAGTHRVAMTYWPPGLTAGIAISLLSAAAWAAAWRGFVRIPGQCETP
jgi:hypothetical protein